MWCMGRRALRHISDPVIAAPPAGLRIRTRIHVTDAEAAALTSIGEFLGELYRAELADRVRQGYLDRGARLAWRVERKRALTRVSSSRWGGAITRAVEDQYQLGLRGLTAHVSDLRVAVGVLEGRCALRPGAVAEMPLTRGSGRPLRGYRTAAERFSKTRRLAALRRRLASAEQALSRGQPSMVMGGKRLWLTRNDLEAAEMTAAQWRHRWDSNRMFLTADGESGLIGGNLTIRVDETGQLRIKTPTALVDRLGLHVVIATPVSFIHRGDDWADRVAARCAVRYDISYDPRRGRWYLDASWKTTPVLSPMLDELRRERVLGVDLNADHLAACVLDASGNPVGDPKTIELATAGLAASRRDGRVRAAITKLLDHAEGAGCAAVVVENLDFADARVVGRETFGSTQRGKRFRRIVAGIPTRKFRARLTAMAARRGIAVIGVDAAYTSKWGRQHWAKPLQHQTSDAVTRHHAAAAAIGRRGLGMAIRRRPAGPRSGQRTAVGTPPTRPDRLRNRDCRHGSSGPPTRTIRGVPVHRRTPANRGQHRSGRPALGPAS